ncbi:hypothetical protein TNCV_4219271 [Trichonephila clavipes]|nr:hypothetical protein TNCV_4219271 [Trichonephila clavipes]
MYIQDRDLVAIEASNRPRLTRIVRVKAVTPKRLGSPPVDRNRLIAHPGTRGYGEKFYPPSNYSTGCRTNIVIHKAKLKHPLSTVFPNSNIAERNVIRLQR